MTSSCHILVLIFHFTFSFSCQCIFIVTRFCHVTVCSMFVPLCIFIWETRLPVDAMNDDEENDEDRDHSHAARLLSGSMLARC